MGWLIETAARDWVQSRAELRLDGETVAEIAGSESAFLEWPFRPLEPGATHLLEVRVAGMEGEFGPWSAAVTITAGFLPEGSWAADFIGLADGADARPGLLRYEFEVTGDVASAYLYATARGVYQASVNGTDVDDAVMKPGWTAYHDRLVHETTDVRSLLRDGGNALGFRIAGGWWSERYGFGSDSHRIYGDQPSVAAELHIRYMDGRTQVVRTGPKWRGAPEGITVSSSIYRGEVIDARRQEAGWNTTGYDDLGWPEACVLGERQTPEPAISEPVRRVDQLRVVKHELLSSGAILVDFGQNLVGRLRLRLAGVRDEALTIRHAEVLENGSLATRPLRAATSVDTIIMCDGWMEIEPEFTFHGFRYAEITGWPGDFDPSAVTAIVLGSDMRRTGWFDSSHPLLNKLHQNVVWGMRGNFLALPTDCPQRDERMGWTGDLQAFAPTAAYLFDCGAFLASWLRDVAFEQARHGGSCPMIVPNVLEEWGAQPVAAWGDAATIVPSVLFERLGDRRTLEDQYPWMKAWADRILAEAGDELVWETGFQFGDWLDPDAPPESPHQAKTPSELIATAFLFRSVSLTAEAASRLGYLAESARYASVADRVRHAWISRYLLGERLVSDSPTAYCLAIMFDLVPGELREKMGRRLSELVRENSYRLGTGFVGTPLLQDALVLTGHADVAHRLIMQTEMPSWLYPVTMGATTVWERWDSMLPSGEINPGEMTSFNHYTFGSIADWLHRHIGGLQLASAGYRSLRIAPRPIPGVDWATTTHESSYGTATVAWRREPTGKLSVEALVPPNSTAEIDLPGTTVFVVGSGSYKWTVAALEAEEN